VSDNRHIGPSFNEFLEEEAIPEEEEAAAAAAIGAFAQFDADSASS
jgi:hypothetical protein